MKTNISNGGYCIVSLKNRNLVFGQYITGDFVEHIRNVIESNYYKPLLLTDIVIEDIDNPDSYNYLGKYGERYVFNAGLYDIIIDSSEIYIRPSVIDVYDLSTGTLPIYNSQQYNIFIKSIDIPLYIIYGDHYGGKITAYAAQLHSLEPSNNSYNIYYPVSISGIKGLIIRSGSTTEIN